jgi:2-iminoacetate synthase
MNLGVTTMSAGSCTAPGGYTGQGQTSLHYTVRGRFSEAEIGSNGAEPQFAIDDNRTPSQVAEAISQLGLEPVWKDWDTAIAKG